MGCDSKLTVRRDLPLDDQDLVPFEDLELHSRSRLGKDLEGVDGRTAAAERGRTAEGGTVRAHESSRIPESARTRPVKAGHSTVQVQEPDRGASRRSHHRL